MNVNECEWLATKVLISEREADTEISSLARKHKAIGILAYDSGGSIYRVSMKVLTQLFSFQNIKNI